MPSFFEITFLPEGRVQRFAGSRGNYYEFEDASHLDVHTVPVWCHKCRDITHGERIDTLEELHKSIADLHDPGSEAYRMTMQPLLPEIEGTDFPENFRLKRIADLQKHCEWRKSRLSPAKCIHCGSTNIVALSWEEPTTISPGPGVVVLRWIGMCSTSFNEWFFTPEGDRIPRDTKPTYWHHPQLDNSAGAARRFIDRITGKSSGRKAAEDTDTSDL